MIRLFKYELIRITSLRSSWVLTILGTSMIAGITFLGLYSMNQIGQIQSVQISELTPVLVPLWGIWAATIASQAFGHDYRHGTIRLTLSTFPNRLQVYLVRVLTVVVWCAVWLALTVGIMIGEISVISTGGVLFTNAGATFGRVSIFFLLFILSAIAIVMITRIMALGTIVPLMMATTVENLVGLFIPENLKWTTEYYPYSKAMSWVMPWNIGDPSYNAYPLTVFTIALLAVAGLMFLKRDA